MANSEQYKRGIDSDLVYAFEFNPQTISGTELTVDMIEKVLAVSEGENDGADWRWIVELNADCPLRFIGRYAFLIGGCDYTGWDCRSYLKTFLTDSLESACLYEKEPEIQEILFKQLVDGKTETWDEKTFKKLILGE